MPSPRLPTHSSDLQEGIAIPERMPFYVQIPDLNGARQQAQSPVGATSELTRPQPSIGEASQTGTVREQIRRLRYDEGHHRMTDLIDRMRDKRQRLVARLWAASIVLTVFSLGALGVELVQQLTEPTTTAEAEISTPETAPPRALVRRSSAHSSRSTAKAGAKVHANQLPGTTSEVEVEAAHFTTTREKPAPDGVWLEGSIQKVDGKSEKR